MNWNGFAQTVFWFVVILICEVMVYVRAVMQ